MESGKINIYLDKFQILKCLNKDNNTAVYIAHHIYLDKKIFLKTLDTNNLSNPDILKRFEREAKTLARLDHPNIIKIYDFGAWKSIYYISFEYYKSNDLRQLLSGSRLSTDQIDLIIKQIILGLNAAHQHNIVHRDIKPENILIDDDFHIKIADFGLALFNDVDNPTHPSSIVGTPAYMSPEQIRGEKLTKASDYFSLGIILFELYTLKNPFLGKDIGQTLNNILNVKIDDYKKQLNRIPDEHAKLIAQLLSRDVTVREKSRDELLKSYNTKGLSNSGIAKSSPSTVNKNKLILIGSAVIIIISVIYLIYLSDSQNVETLSAILPDSSKETSYNDTTLFIPPPEIKPENNLNSAINIVRNSDIEKAKLSKIEDRSDSTLLLPGKLIVNCKPWAYVYVDSILVDSTPLSRAIELSPGIHSIILKHPEYPNYNSTIQIESNSNKAISINLENLVGYLDCKVYPWGEIFINDQLIGQSPLASPVRLFPGEYNLTIKNSGFDSFSKGITITKQDTLKFKHDFAEKMVSAKEE
jgi:serine/threonine-protein kinase